MFKWENDSKSAQDVYFTYLFIYLFIYFFSNNHYLRKTRNSTLFSVLKIEIPANFMRLRLKMTTSQKL